MLIRLKCYLLQTDFAFPFKQKCAMKLQTSVLLCKVNPLRNLIYPPIFFLKILLMLLYLVHISLHCADWGWCFLNIFHKNISNHRFSRWKWRKQIIPFIRLAKIQSENFIYLCFQNTIKQFSVYFAIFFFLWHKAKWN